MKQYSFKVNVVELLNSPIGTVINYDLIGRLENEEDIKFSKPVTVKARLTRIEEGIIAHCRVSGEAQLVCSRCDQEFINVIEADFERLFSQQTKDNDEDLLIAKDWTIDLSVPIREEIIISIPIKRLCDINCKGRLG